MTKTKWTKHTLDTRGYWIPAATGREFPGWRPSLVK